MQFKLWQHTCTDGKCYFPHVGRPAATCVLIESVDIDVGSGSNMKFVLTDKFMLFWVVYKSPPPPMSLIITLYNLTPPSPICFIPFDISSLLWGWVYNLRNKPIVMSFQHGNDQIRFIHLE